MTKSSFQKSYDVKTFLGKKRSGDRMMILTLSNPGMGFFISLCLVAVFVAAAYRMLPRIPLAGLLETGVEEALPFVHCAGRKVDLSFENTLALAALPQATFVPPEEDKTAVRERPPLPDGEVREETVYTNGVEIKNETEYEVDALSILGEDILLPDSGRKVLIVHTHGSESYTPSENYYYEHTGNYRTGDTRFNMIKVGEAFASALREKGIEVIHDKTINDSPSYNDSYNKAGKVIEKHLRADGDIAFVFDIHRDAVGTPDKAVKFVSEIQGSPTAQIMIVCGTDTNLENPAWRDNLRLAVHLQNYFDVNYTGLMRPLNLRKERFNMHLSVGSLLLEVGTNGNTMEEALRAAEVLGEGVGEFIKTLE